MMFVTYKGNYREWEGLGRRAGLSHRREDKWCRARSRCMLAPISSSLHFLDYKSIVIERSCAREAGEVVLIHLF